MEAVRRNKQKIRCCTRKPSNSCYRGDTAGRAQTGIHMLMGGACLEPVAATDIAGQHLMSCNTEHHARLSVQSRSSV